ncbi:hypothetical protein F4167_00480, partial [Candidatus Poribacteria bacterium]|nr:hypothetical protein [Candidatus Poribacteria bacterium]
MKRKQFLILLLISFLPLVLLHNAFAQDYTWFNLPEDAKRRIGKGRITDMAYSPDGNQLAVSTNIGIWIYDARTGEERNALFDHTQGIITGIAYSPDGRTLVSGGSKILLWDTATGEHKAPFTGPFAYANAVEFSPDGKTIATGRSDEVHLWDAVTGEPKGSFKATARWVSNIAFSSDGKTIASSGGLDGTIRLWDVATATFKATLQGHTDSIISIAFSPDGSTLASSSWDYTIRLWDTTTLAHKGTLAAPHIRYGPEGIAFSPDGRTLAHAGYNYDVVLWDVPSGQIRKTLTGHTTDNTNVRNLAFSPDGRTLASGRGEIRLCVFGSGEHKTTFVGHMDRVTSVVFSPDGRTLAGSEGKMIHVWELPSGVLQTTLRGHTDEITSVVFSPDGRTLASGSRDKTIRLWDARSGQHQRTLIGHTQDVYSVAFSPDGKTIATGTGYIGEPYEVWLWNAATGKYKALKSGFRNPVSFAFSPDGQTLATQTKMGQQVMLWDAVTGAIKKTFPWHTHHFSNFAFSPDGQTLATGTRDGFVFLWEIAPDILQPAKGTSTILPPLPVYPPQIRLIHFFPSDHTLQPNMHTELETLAKETQDFYAEQMEHHGFGRKTFQLETDSNGKIVVHHLQGGSPAQDYTSRSVSILRELEDLLDLIDHIYLVVLDPSLQGCLGGLCGLASYSGIGVSSGAFQMSNNGRLAVVYATGHCAGVGTTAHELGHTFGLQHDYRDKNYVMNHGAETPRFSYAAAEWLNVHPFLNASQPNSENPTTIEVLSPRASGLQFRVSDPDGLHQAQLVLTEKISEAFCGGSTESLSNYKALNGSPSTTFKFVATETSTEANLRVIDLHGNVAWKTLWIESDSIVQIQPDTDIQPYEREKVRLIYFRPSDRPSRQDIDTELDTLIRWSQYFFAEQMQNYGRKTFAFETDDTGHAQVHHVTGKFTDAYYHSDTYNKVVKEVAEQFDTSRDVLLIAVDVSSEFINNEGICGIGGGGWISFDNEHWRRDFGGTAVIPASGVCINPSIAAHELGHVFGLEHDFRDDAYLMAYGTQERLSHCAAEWLDAHRFFNNDPTTSNETTTITMHLSQAADPGTLQLQFELTDTDGLHQAQLIVPTAASDPAQGIKLHSCRSLNAKNHTVEFLMTDANLLLDSEVTLQVIDATGNITKQAFSLVLAEDDTVVLASPALEFSAMQAPTETALLPNYPNPFNPETWIPYQLAAPCKVTIEIHAIDGSLVRVLSLGHKATGIYQNRTRAAYWDGRN